MADILEAPLPLYESAVFRSIAGSALRPGGTAITEAALDACAEACPDIGFGVHSDVRPDVSTGASIRACTDVSTGASARVCTDAFSSLATARMLDLGCGAGATLELLRQRGYQCLGLDLSSVLLREAAQKGPVVQGDAACPPFADQSFDILFCECVFSLLSGKAEVLGRYKKLLKPGGVLILSDLFAASPTGWQGNTCAARAISVMQMQELLEASGFQIVHESDQTRYLQELAAKMIFYAGSVEAFQKLWQQEAASRSTISRTGAEAPDTPDSGKTATAQTENREMQTEKTEALKNGTQMQAKFLSQADDGYPALPVSPPTGACACKGNALRYLLFIAKVA